MHQVMFVILPKEDAYNADEAIIEVECFLESNSFVGGEGYWGGGKCDWFQMGGRWSGRLSCLTWAKDLVPELAKCLCKMFFTVWTHILVKKK